MSAAFSDAKNARVAGRVLGVEKLIRERRRRSPIPRTTTERVLAAKQRIGDKLADRRIAGHARKRANTASITHSRSIGAPDWTKRAEVFNAVAGDTQDRRSCHAARLHVDSRYEPAVTSKHRYDRLSKLTEVGDGVEHDRLRRSGWNGDLLRLVCAGNVDDENTGARL